MLARVIAGMCGSGRGLLGLRRGAPPRRVSIRRRPAFTVNAERRGVRAVVAVAPKSRRAKFRGDPVVAGEGFSEEPSVGAQLRAGPTWPSARRPSWTWVPVLVAEARLCSPSDRVVRC